MCPHKQLISPEKWIEEFKRQQEPLTKFIAKWYPGSPEFGSDPVPLPVTAPNAEAARQQLQPKDPPYVTVNDIPGMIERKEVPALYALLSDCWMAVPESTECWMIEGFANAVHMLDDPPEYDEPGDPENN